MKERFCICRSKDSCGFMIFCERCEEWFHGKCVDIKKTVADKIDKYYCKACLETVPGLKIEYKPGCEPPPEKKQPNNNKVDIVEDKKPEKKVLEKIQSTSKPTPVSISQKKTANQTKKRVYQRKSKTHTRKQCANPECIFESRQDSKYCSDECGISFNRLRYQEFFIPRWRKLEENPSEARQLKRAEVVKLHEEQDEIIKVIKNLKMEKEQLEKNIKIIKEHATKQAKERNNSKKDTDDEDEESNDDVEEAATGDALKTYCITCGMTIINPTQTLKHWFTCHRKQEDCYNFTADAVFQHSCEGDENPKLYCHQQDKKTKRYCMHLESACPQHSNWSSNKDEVCGCPLNVMQELIPDPNGGYCLELKKDCTQHYHWDKFRLAQLNMQRIQAFTRYDVIQDKIRNAKANYDDTYGGVIGVMLHETTDERETKEGRTSESPNNEEGDRDVDVEMSTN